jgi:hypothetical protein
LNKRRKGAKARQEEGAKQQFWTSKTHHPQEESTRFFFCLCLRPRIYNPAHPIPFPHATRTETKKKKQKGDRKPDK